MDSDSILRNRLYVQHTVTVIKNSNTEDPRYNDCVCYQIFGRKIEFAVIKKLDKSVTDTFEHFFLQIIRYVKLLESPRRGDSNKYTKRTFS